MPRATLPRCGLPVVARLRVTDDGADVSRALEWARSTAAFDPRGRRVLLAANFNSPDPYPATSDLPFLARLVEALRARGAGEVAVGASCGLRWAPAAGVFRRLGADRWADAHGIRLVNFDEGPWRSVPVEGAFFDCLDIAQAVFEADLLVFACCLKTHRAARFSISLKHAVGLLPPRLRRAMHDRHLEERIADVGRAVQPDLVLVDARACFVTGGPDRGRVRRPGLLLAGTDRVAVDVEGLKVLRRFRAWNRLHRDPWAHRQVRAAVDAGLGTDRVRGYEVVDG